MKKLLIVLGVILSLLLSSCGGDVETTKDAMDAGGTTPASSDGGAVNTTEATEATSENTQVSFDVDKAAQEYFSNMPKHINMISAKDFIEAVKSGEEATIIDIRSAKDYAKGHVKGAVNMPWNTMAIAEGLKLIPEDKPAYLYCYTGQTAGQAVGTMVMAGVDVRTVSLGYDMGISKVEGVDEFVETDESVLTEVVREINPDAQAAVNQYYESLMNISDKVYKNHKISEKNLKALIDAKDDSIFILSIRQKDAFDKAHIEGAHLIPFNNDTAKHFSELPKDKKIIVYCYTGQTAGQTTAVLRMIGYDAVSLNGGIGTPKNEPMGWINQGYPVVTE